MAWFTHIFTFLAGLGAGWSLKIYFSYRNNSSSTHENNYDVDQHHNKVTNGSIVGRDQNDINK